jgi:hypothetical protein
MPTAFAAEKPLKVNVVPSSAGKESKGASSIDSISACKALFTKVRLREELFSLKHVMYVYIRPMRIINKTAKENISSKREKACLFLVLFNIEFQIQAQL